MKMSIAEQIQQALVFSILFFPLTLIFLMQVSTEISGISKELIKNRYLQKLPIILFFVGIQQLFYNFWNI